MNALVAADRASELAPTEGAGAGQRFFPDHAPGLQPRTGRIHRRVHAAAAAHPADNGLLAPQLASGIARIKSVRPHGVRVGNWLSLQQAQALLNAPDVRTKRGLRDRAMLATLLGCGLRRSELAALTMRHVQQRDNRWCIVDGPSVPT